MVFEVKDFDETRAPLLDHLIELRGRLLRCVFALAVAFAVCLYFADDIFGFLVKPLTEAFPEGNGKLIYTQLYEAFFVELKVALFAAFCVSFPIIANQLWAFVAPGLYAREKKAFLPFLLMTPVLFTAGAALAYYVVMPTAFKWFLGFEGQVGGLDIEALPGTGNYLSFVMQFARRYVIVGVVALAAVVTPPDPGSQIILALPLLVLFEGSLLLMRFQERRSPKDREAESDSSDPVAVNDSRSVSE